jgi:hypothetical protein
LQEIVAKIKDAVRKGGDARYLAQLRKNGFWIKPDDPAHIVLGPADLTSVKMGDFLRKFYVKKVYAWIPDVIFMAKVTCPYCVGTNTIRWSWAHRRIARRVCLGKDTAWLVSPRYLCNNCKRGYKKKKQELRDQGREVTKESLGGGAHTRSSKTTVHASGLRHCYL